MVYSENFGTLVYYSIMTILNYTYYADTDTEFYNRIMSL